MSPEIEQRTAQNRTPRIGTGWYLAGLGLTIIGGLLFWFFFQSGFQPDPKPEEVPTRQTESPETEAITTPPDIVNAFDVTEITVNSSPAATTPLEQSAVTPTETDGVIAEYLSGLNIGQLGEQFTTQDNGIERGIAIIDSIRLGSVPYKLLPMGRPSEKFPFQDNGLAVTLDPKGFERYEGLANTVAGINVPMALELYDILSTALEEVWSALGYGGTTFNDAAMGALNMILLAPATDFEARLYKDEANWRYEDESLETLPAIQKQLMRMGPTNAEKIQNKARELRGALLDRNT